MRRFHATVLSVVPLLLTSVAVALPASAGGPTSVLLASPQTEEAASLYYSDPDYTTLARLVGAEGGNGVAGLVDDSGASHDSGAAITLTWLVHDVMVWRVDRVYLDARDGPWIATQSDSGGSGNLWDAPVVWHQVAEGPQLVAMLDQMGLTQRKAEAGAAVGTDSDAAAPVAGAPRQAANEPAERTSGSEQRQWLWGAAGLALGTIIALGGVRVNGVRRRRAAAPVTPRLGDDGPFGERHPEEPDGAVDWSVPDELASTSRQQYQT